jgi:uncharacterized protein YdaL
MVPIFHVSLHEVGHILKLGDNNETDTVMYKALIPVHHDITEIDKGRAQAIWGHKTRKAKTSVINTSSKTNSIQYDYFKIFIMLTTIIIILFVLLIVAVIFGVRKNGKKEVDVPESNQLIVNNNSI